VAALASALLICALHVLNRPRGLIAADITTEIHGVVTLRKGLSVLNRSVPFDSALTGRGWIPALAAAFLLVINISPVLAQDAPLPPVTVGGGVRTSFTHTEPAVGASTDAFALDSARLYINGSAAPKIKFMFNTEYNGADNAVGVLDAVARFEFSDKFNIWAGRFLPPSDRANLYGPYYANPWAVYTDGVQDGYPFIFQGRDNGAAYWGQFGKVKLSAGAFDGKTASGDTTVLSAGRIQVDFWDPEGGYYLNGTYYGDKNLLAIGAAAQAQGSNKSAYSADFLLERKVPAGGAVSVEAEWAKYDHLGGYSGRYGVDDGGYVLGAYLFPKLSGPGRFQVLAKFAKARFREGLTARDLNYDQKTTEVNLNYIIRQFNARVMGFFKDTRFDAVLPDSKQVGVGLQIQM